MDYLTYLLIPNLKENNSKNFVSFCVDLNIKTNLMPSKLWLLTKLLEMCVCIVTGAYNELLSNDSYSNAKCIQLGLQSCELILGISTSSALVAIGDTCSMEEKRLKNNSLTVLLLCLYRMHLFEYLYSSLEFATKGFIQMTSDDNLSSSKTLARRESADCCVLLIMRTLDVITKYNNTVVEPFISSRIFKRWIHYFARILFTIPLIQVALSDNIKHILINWKYFDDVLVAASELDDISSISNEINTEMLYLFNSNNVSVVNTQVMNWLVLPLKHKVYNSNSSLAEGDWIWGNLSSLAQVLDSHLCATDIFNNNTVGTHHLLNDDQISLYLELLSKYICKQYLDQVLLCKPGMLWSKTSAGNNQSAEPIPFYFTQQIMCLYSQSFNGRIIDRILSDVNSFPINSATKVVSIHPSNEVNKDIEQDIKTSLESTAFNIAKRQLIQEETNRLQKLSNKVVNTATAVFKSVFSWIGLSSSSSSNNAKEQSVLPNNSGIIKSKVNLTSDNNINIRLLNALFRFWGIIFPHAVNSAMDSWGWQLLTKLAFYSTTPTDLSLDVSCNSLITKLWIIFSHYDYSILTSKSISGCIGETMFDLCVIISVLLRIMLIVMDDDEVYVKGVSHVYICIHLC